MSAHHVCTKIDIIAFRAIKDAADTALEDRTDLMQ